MYELQGSSTYWKLVSILLRLQEKRKEGFLRKKSQHEGKGEALLKTME